VFLPLSKVSKLLVLALLLYYIPLYLLPSTCSCPLGLVVPALVLHYVSLYLLPSTYSLSRITTWAAWKAVAEAWDAPVANR
jgi:hypothetical protein